jgi:hypothetical protein
MDNEWVTNEEQVDFNMNVFLKRTGRRAACYIKKKERRTGSVQPHERITSTNTKNERGKKTSTGRCRSKLQMTVAHNIS